MNALKIAPPLKANTVFRPSVHLSVEDRSRAIAAATKVFGRRDYLPAQDGQTWLLKNGVVRSLTYREDGTIITLGIWAAGDVVGSHLSDADPYLVEALTVVEAISIGQANWLPSAEHVLTQARQTETLMLLRANRRADSILWGVLQWLAQRFGHPVDQGYMIDLKVTHQDLADLTGATRVTITRLLKQFEAEGLIQRRSRQLLLSSVVES